MKPLKLLLGKNKHKLGVNENNHIGLSLVNERRVMPPTDYTATIDAYETYFAEKDASDKYRLSFTINPICSNVLFNVITEPVYKEGSDDTIVFLDNGATKDITGSMQKYQRWKFESGYNPIKADYDRYALIHDTGYSHKDIGPVEYHCGYDIFDNHYLRRRDGFFIINYAKKKEKLFQLDGKSGRYSVFNTIADTLRNRSGDNVTDTIFMETGGNGSATSPENLKLNSGYGNIHVYHYDGVNSFYDSITENLVERDGWLGFLNKVSMPVINYSAVTGSEKVEVVLNKCMNDDPAYGQIDMYPGRSLYSFVPKYNKYRRREENNWNFCITYPYSATTKDGEGDSIEYIEGEGVNGILCEMATMAEISREQTNVQFISSIKHGFSTGESVKLYFYGKDGNTETKNPILIRSVSKDGHGFSARISDIAAELFVDDGNGGTRNRNIAKVRVARVHGGIPCKYYVRLFKKIDLNFDTQITRAAFSLNAYSDRIAQIALNGDIEIGDLSDNLGRPLSELYLTLIKNNKGHELWYDRNVFNDENIEFSHCFGPVSAGIDLPTDEFCEKYNIHRIHNIANADADSRGGGIPHSPAHLKTGITIDDDEFYGDIVEFSPGEVSERILEPIYYRFNTAQRETTNSHYSTFYITDITSDDYDFSENGFSISAGTYTNDTGLKMNLIPEGYYYNPNYRIKIREFSDTVNQGYDRRLAFTRIRDIGNKKYEITLSANYYIEAGDRIYSFTKNNGDVINGGEWEVDSVNKLTITVSPKSSENGALNKNCILFRRNTEKPATAYDLNDGTGRYLWRDIVSSSEISPDSDLFDSVFTNGAHYFHKNITFYLRRQDPDASYGIGDKPDDIAEIFIINNVAKDVSVSEYVEEGVNKLC